MNGESMLKKSFLLITLLILSGCASTGKTVTQEERNKLVYDLGVAALRDGDAIGALEQFFKVEKEQPDWAELRLSMALAYYMKSDFVNAITEARKSVSLNPNYTEANSTLGKFLVDAGKYNEAEKYLNKALEDPLYREAYKAHTNLGILHYRNGAITKAQNYFDRAIQGSPLGACIAYYYKGHILLKNKKFGDAIKEYQKSSNRFCSQFIEGHLALGIAYERSGQYHLARKAFLDIKERFPNSKYADEAMNRLAYLP
jgi:Tfp pilus assembly protein PilF